MAEDPIAALRAQLEALPKYQLHVLLQSMTPYVMPFTTDPNETGAFVRWSDVGAVLASSPSQPGEKAEDPVPRGVGIPAGGALGSTASDA